MKLLTYAFDSNCKFFFKKCLFKYEKREFLFRVGDDRYCEQIQTIADNNEDESKIFKSVIRFSNCFAWSNHCSLYFRGSSAKGLNRRIDLIKIKDLHKFPRNFGRIGCHFKTTIEPKTQEQELALSLHNEAKSSNNIFYRFLCYWKILEINYKGRGKKTTGDWINEIII